MNRNIVLNYLCCVYTLIYVCVTMVNDYFYAESLLEGKFKSIGLVIHHELILI